MEGILQNVGPLNNQLESVEVNEANDPEEPKGLVTDIRRACDRPSARSMFSETQ